MAKATSSNDTATPTAPESEPFVPLPERIITDVETLKALSDPLRIRILEAMVQATDEAWTAKRIAKALGVGQTKLYHHLKILEDRELIRPIDRQLVRGIVETSYQIAQLSLRLDRQLFAGGSEARSDAERAMSMVFDVARRDLERALAAGLIPVDPAPDGPPPLMLTRSLIKTSPEKAAELRERLAALIAEYNDDRDGEVTMALLVALHPVLGPTPRGKSTSGGRNR